MDCSTPGFPVLHHLPEHSQTRVHWVCDAIQPSISLHWSLKKAFLSLLAILWNSAFKWVYLSFSLCFSLLFFSQVSHTVLKRWIGKDLRREEKGTTEDEMVGWHHRLNWHSPRKRNAKKKKKKAEEALQIAVKRREMKSKEKRKDIPTRIPNSKE